MCSVKRLLLFRHKIAAGLIADREQETGNKRDCLLHLRNNSSAHCRKILSLNCYRIYIFIPYHVPKRGRSYG